MNKKTTIGLVLSGLLLLGTVGAMAMTADEILNEMEDLFSVDAGDAQGILTTMTLFNDYSGGVSSEYTLAMFELTTFDASMPEDADEITHVLMYFVGGDEDGSIFLMETPEDDSMDSRMWLYLPALGLTKELVSEDDQSGSFAGSSMSYGDLGGTGDFREDYDAVILREETRNVDGEVFDVWILELKAKAGVDADHARVLLTVSQEDFLTLRMEAYNDSGALESTMEFQLLGEFEGDRIPERIYSTNVAEATSSTITISGTRRSNMPLTLELFDPNNLGVLDPATYGF